MSDKSELKAELERKKQRLAQIREEKKRKEEERKKKEVCACLKCCWWNVILSLRNLGVCFVVVFTYKGHNISIMSFLSICMLILRDSFVASFSFCFTLLIHFIFLGSPILKPYIYDYFIGHYKLQIQIMRVLHALKSMSQWLAILQLHNERI